MSAGLGEAVLAAPLRLEALLVASGARGRVVRRTGMGPARARTAARGLSLRQAGSLVVVGFCGGLDAGSVPGEVIVADEVYAAADEGHAERPVSCVLRDELVTRLTGRGLKVRCGPIVCVSRPALGRRRAELQAGGAIAVDMESVWLAGAARERPFGVVRVVLDSPSHELLRPGAVFGALRAARALRSVSAALNDMVQDG
jgi:4-hydroxy-3-methylbut-2-enyl diphosphate reductase